MAKREVFINEIVSSSFFYLFQRNKNGRIFVLVAHIEKLSERALSREGEKQNDCVKYLNEIVKLLKNFKIFSTSSSWKEKARLVLIFFSFFFFFFCSSSFLKTSCKCSTRDKEPSNCCV